MKFTNLLLALGLIALSSSTLKASASGEALFEAKCAVCHVKVRPDDKSTLVAPPAMGVMRHVKMNGILVPKILKIENTIPYMVLEFIHFEKFYSISVYLRPIIVIDSLAARSAAADRVG